jgi:hypothetical protein
MIVTIHQPDFLPWLGFFDRWIKSDLYIVLDDVQFIRRGWQHRDRIKTEKGVQWLTVPVVKKGRYFQEIRAVELNNQSGWWRTHLNTLRQAYGKAPKFDTVYNKIKEILSKEHKLLIDLNMDLLYYCSDALEIKTPVVFSSSFKESGKGTDRLVRLIKAAGGGTYLTGLGSKDYLMEEAFNIEEIEVYWQKFSHPIYPQLHGNFEKELSIIDFLMMVHDPKGTLHK